MLSVEIPKMQLDETTPTKPLINDYDAIANAYGGTLPINMVKQFSQRRNPPDTISSYIQKKS